jgi:hypothetical protein
MRNLNNENPAGRDRANPSRRSRQSWLVGSGCLLVALIALLLPLRNGNPGANAQFAAVEEPRDTAAAGHPNLGLFQQPRRGNDAPALTAAEIVADKFKRFASNRRDLVHAMATRYKLDVPADLDRLFDALEANRWQEAQALFKSLSPGSTNGTPLSDEQRKFWRPVVEAYGAAEQVQAWPAQKLLDYGNAILGSLSPGMVYVGGTDSGCFIPTMLNETSGGENHIVLTQNALADASYLDYLSFQYGDRLATLTPDDSQQAFQEYLADAQKRAEHDQQFPDEPKRVLPGENITVTDGRVQVSGQVAVMAINELLFQELLQKNPDMSFALQESFPFKSTYADAVPLGPIMELRAPDGQSAFTSDTAAQAVNDLQTISQQLLSDPEAAASLETMKSYSHDAVAQANLLAAHNYSDAAEQAYQIASSLWPDNPEPINGLAQVFANTGHADQATALIQNFVQAHPEQSAYVEAEAAAGRFTTAPPAQPRSP